MSAAGIAKADLEARAVFLIGGEPGALCAHGGDLLQRIQDGRPALGLLLRIPHLLGHLGHHLRHLQSQFMRHACGRLIL